MKKVAKALFLCLAIFSLVACNNAAGTGSINDPNAPAILKSVELRLSIAEMNYSRTFFPSAWTDETAGRLIYELTGHVVGDVSTELQLVDDAANEDSKNSPYLTYTELIGGTAEVNVKPLNWALTLTAYEPADDSTEAAPIPDENKSVLIGTTTVDLSTNATSGAIFYMNPVEDAETESVGDVDISLTFVKTDNFAKVVYGLFTSNELLTDYTNKLTETNGVTGTYPLELETAGLTEVDADAKTYKFDLTDTVNPGRYYFGAFFYDAEDKLLIQYFEDFYVDAANKSTKDIVLPDILNTPPTKPENFAVSYVFNEGANQELVEDDTTISTYDAVFTWDDTSDNEAGFEIVLEKCNADGTVITGEGEETITFNADSAENATSGSGTLVAGNLRPSSTTCTIELTTGVAYKAKIRSYNRFTPTDYTADWVECASLVNTFTVTYVLNAGCVQFASKSTDVTAADVVKYAIPYELSANAQELMPGSYNGSYPVAVYTNNAFEYWKVVADDEADCVRIDEIAANNIANIVVEAIWSNPMSITMVLPDYSGYPIQLVNTYDENYAYTTIVGSTVTMKASSGLTNPTWTLMSLDGTTNGTTEITEGVTTEGTNFEWDTTGVEAGSYVVEITGTVSSELVPGSDSTVDKSVQGYIYIKLTN